MNVVELAGTLTRDPELRDTRGGGLVAEMTVAVKSIRWDRDAGCDVIEQAFFSVLAWDDVAETAARLSKGAFVHVRGQLTQQEVEKNGKKERKTKIRALVLSVIRSPVEDKF